jgi:hypothetical protein
MTIPVIKRSWAQHTAVSLICAALLLLTFAVTTASVLSDPLLPVRLREVCDGRWRVTNDGANTVSFVWTAINQQADRVTGSGFILLDPGESKTIHADSRSDMYLTSPDYVDLYEPTRQRGCDGAGQSGRSDHCADVLALESLPYPDGTPFTVYMVSEDEARSGAVAGSPIPAGIPVHEGKAGAIFCESGWGEGGWFEGRVGDTVIVVWHALADFPEVEFGPF